MKSYTNIEQGTIEWHRIRFGKVGGTSSKQLHVAKGDTLLNELVSCKLEPYNEDEEASFKSAAMQRGNDLEPEARAALEDATGLKFTETGWVEMDGCQLMGMSPDGITEDGKAGCEIKCPSKEVHVAYLRAGVLPMEHMNQVVQFFAVNEKLETVWFASYRPECDIPLFKIKVERHSMVNTGTAAKPVMKDVATHAMNKRVLGLQLAEDVEKEVKRVIENQF